MPESVYIHIPFCKQKCKYCSFISYTNLDLRTGYIYSLLKEITENYYGEKLNTLYFGGGTPSLIKPDLLEKIIKKFNFTENAEITLEINPDDADFNYLKSLKDIGINRLSIGSQTFNDNILKIIGRRHNSTQILQTVIESKRAGFENISVDLIYGLPLQTLENLKSDLDKFLDLDIKHISTYGLKIDEGSFFSQNPPKNIPDDDTQADMYETINEILENNGFIRYEISNFSQKGYESRHNLNYWNNNEYYGFGVASHGYINGIRYSNSASLEKYLNSPNEHEFGKFVTPKEQLEEEIFLGLRKTEGININNINKKYRIDFEKKYKNILNKYRDYFIKTTKGYSLNLNGILLSNIILSDFIE